MITNYHHHHHYYGITSITSFQYTTTSRQVVESRTLHHQSGGSVVIRPKFLPKEIEKKMSSLMTVRHHLHYCVECLRRGPIEFFRYRDLAARHRIAASSGIVWLGREYDLAPLAE